MEKSNKPRHLSNKTLVSFLLILLLDLKLISSKIHNQEYKSSNPNTYYHSQDNAFSWRGNIHSTCSNTDTNLAPLWTEMYPYNYVETLSIKNFTFMPYIPEGEFFSSLTTVLIRSRMKSEHSTNMNPPNMYLTNEYGETLNMLQAQDFKVTNYYRLLSSHSEFKGKERFLISTGTKFSVDIDVGLFPGAFDDKFYVECVDVFITYETSNIIRTKPTVDEGTTTYPSSTEGSETEGGSQGSHTSINTNTHVDTGSEGNSNSNNENTQTSNLDINGSVMDVEINFDTIIFIILAFFIFVAISAFCTFSVLMSVISMYKKRFNSTLIDEKNCQLVEEYWNPNVLVLHNLSKNTTIVYYTKFRNFYQIKDYATDIETFAMFSSSNIVEGQKVYSRTREMGYTIEGIWFQILENFPIVTMIELLVDMHRKNFIHGRISRQCFWYKSKGFDPSKNCMDMSEVRIFDLEAVNGSNRGREFYPDEEIFENESTGDVIFYSEKSKNDKTLSKREDVWQFVNNFKVELGLRDVNDFDLDKGFEGLLELVKKGVVK